MTKSGIDYLIRFSKIQKGVTIGDIKAIDFKTLNDGTQMGHLIIDCYCKKHKKRFSISANRLNWKISKFCKKSLENLNYQSIYT